MCIEKKPKKFDMKNKSIVWIEKIGFYHIRSFFLLFLSLPAILVEMCIFGECEFECGYFILFSVVITIFGSSLSVSTPIHLNHNFFFFFFVHRSLSSHIYTYIKIICFLFTFFLFFSLSTF